MFGGSPFGAVPFADSGSGNGGGVGPLPVVIVTGVTATPSAVFLDGGASVRVLVVVAGVNNPSQTGTWVKVSGVGTVSAVGLITAPAATSTQQTGLFRFISTQDAAYFVDVVLTVAASAPGDSGNTSYATHIFEQFASRQGIDQANLVGMHWYVFAAVGDQSLGAPFAQGLVETTDNAGYTLIDITGQTAVLAGLPVTLAFSNADGDPDQIDLISWFGTVRAL